MISRAVATTAAAVPASALFCVGGMLTIAAAANHCVGIRSSPTAAAPQRLHAGTEPAATSERDESARTAGAGDATRPATAEALCLTSAGWTKPVHGPVVSGFRTSSRPGHDGVDIAAAKGTPIQAAAAGQVLRVVCDARLRNGTPFSCDVDGHPINVLGCGWFLEVMHTDGTVTRYCHLVRRPLVTERQSVTAGQILGHVGSSGHCSGPHLHLETHIDHPASGANAVDPAAFFAVRGVDLTIE